MKTALIHFALNAKINYVYNFNKIVCDDDPAYADGCAEHAGIPNYCQDQKEFMRKNCPKSCGFCTAGK